MTVYYNEFNHDAAQWLENLILKGHIAYGHVDTRSIEDVRPDELRGYAQCHFFAGIGVWSYALRRAGWEDERPVWSGSCPCQPFSAAGKGAAFADERHLWPAFDHLIKVGRPPVLVGEQVASAAVDDWIDLVHADLEALGYAFGSIPFPSAGVGAPHIRDRNFWAAVAVGQADSDGPGLEGRKGNAKRSSQRVAGAGGMVGRLADADGGACGKVRAHVRGRAVGGDAQPRAGLGRGGMPDRLENTEHGRRSIGESKWHGTGANLPSVATGRLADAELQQRRDGQSRISNVDAAPGWQQGEAETAGLRDDLRPGPTNGFWRAADWLGCRDGKWRPVEPGSFPLAYGLPAGMGKLSAGARRLAGLAGLDAASLKRAKSHRIIGLRGAGNAINAEAAIAWIETVMECIA